MRQPLRMLLPLLGLIAAGCPDEPPTADFTPAQVADKLQTALCAAATKCYHIATEFCAVTAQPYWPSPSELTAAANAGRTKINQTKVQECADAFSTATCELLSHSGMPQACRDALIGTVAVGGDCANNFDCLHGTCDLKNTTGSSTCPGKCVAFIADGGDCGYLKPCDPSTGAICSGTTNKCTAPADTGAACVSYRDCLSRNCQSHKCAVPGGGGAACSSEFDCTGGMYCHKSNPQNAGICTAKIALNGACGEDTAHLAPDELFPQCVVGSLCAGVFFNTSMGVLTPGTCKAGSDEGGACTSPPMGQSGVTGCLLGLTCTNGKCAKLPKSGPCATDSAYRCDPGSYCDPTMTCVALKGTGTACADAYECQSYKCDTTAKTCTAAFTCPEK